MQFDPSESSAQACSEWLKGTYRRRQMAYFLKWLFRQEAATFTLYGGIDANIASWK